MKLQDNPYLPQDTKELVRQLDSLWRGLAQQVNQLSEGSIVATYNAATAAPTTGTYAHGDYVRNAAPVEAGAAASKYVVLGWTCVAAGTPGTWLQCRALTGN
ncbi:hypothetical protein ACFQZQ_02870 [Lysobacter koreensis]|uniref:Chitin-binding type-3 domain-containing protein n=1 Tax=Lysobacter koreensis TaxID=266122 RepID=A0ABW2YJ60_9GAMM